MRSLLSLVVGLSITMFVSSASAYGTGATGYTGKQAGNSCNSCHTGGTAPTVTITGPDSLAPGATGDFQMVVMTAQTRAGGGLAATDGVKLTAGTNFKLDKDELTHSAGVAVAGGQATFSFKVTAPAAGSTFKLYAVGLAANGSGTAGDKATQITKDIAITTPGTTPPPATTDAGAPMPGEEKADQTPGSTTTSSDATEPAKTGKTKSSDDGDEEDGDDDDDDDSDRPNRRAKFNAASCNVTPGAIDPAGAGAAGAVLLGLALLGRRRRR